MSGEVSLETPEPEIARMRARDEIVLAKRKFIVAIDYPLARPVEVPVEAALAERRGGTQRHAEDHSSPRG